MYILCKVTHPFVHTTYILTYSRPSLSSPRSLSPSPFPAGPRCELTRVDSTRSTGPQTSCRAPRPLDIARQRRQQRRRSSSRDWRLEQSLAFPPPLAFRRRRRCNSVCSINSVASASLVDDRDVLFSLSLSFCPFSPVPSMQHHSLHRVLVEKAKPWPPSLSVPSGDEPSKRPVLGSCYRPLQTLAWYWRCMSSRTPNAAYM